MSQSEFANIIGIGLRTYTRYEKEERQPDLNVLLEIHKKFDVSLDWLIAGTGSRIGLDTIFSPYFDILKNICPEDEHAEVETEILEEMIKSINTKIAKYLVSSLLKEVKDLPLFEKAKNLIIINDLGATVRIWSIIEQASLDTSDCTAKEKIIMSAKKGFSLNNFLISRGEKDLMVKFVESWSDDICNFLLENSKTFIEALKQLSPNANSTITSNTKILEFVRRLSNKS